MSEWQYGIDGDKHRKDWCHTPDGDYRPRDVKHTPDGEMVYRGQVVKQAEFDAKRNRAVAD